jgi:GMP synthase-like glutamine amidotransferase
MRIHCIEHVAYEGPGTIAWWASDRGHVLTAGLARDGDLPPLAEVDLLVVMGGPMGALDDASYPWLADEKRYIADAAHSGTRVLCVCLGAQILAVALGGSVRRMPEREIGWYPVTLSAAGRSSRVFGGWPDTFVAGHWHGDTFELPEGVMSAASSDACANQAFETAGGRVVGLQFHLEWAREDLDGLIAPFGEQLAEGGTHVATARELTADPVRFDTTRTLLFDLLDRMEALTS